jgi:hypothetical protein
MKRKYIFQSALTVLVGLWISVSSMAQVSFVGSNISSGGGTPLSVAIGDINGDGFKDMAVACQSSSKVFVFTNSGLGQMTNVASYTVGSAVSVAMGDLNNDGKLDLAVANSGSNTVSVLTNTGNGGFGAQVLYTTGSGTASVSIGDVNSDGKLDLVIANYNSNSFSVLTNTGSGAFATKSDYITDSGPNHVALGDVNGDGKLDIVAACGPNLVVAVHTNTGNGSFSTNVNYTVGGQWSYNVALADLNGDGKLDIATANNGATNISVLNNNGNGTFGTNTNYVSGLGIVRVAIGDINGDGKLDLVSANYNANSISVLTNTGNGSFAAKFDFNTNGTNPWDVVLSDLDGDGKLDAIVLNRGSNQISLLLNKTPTIATAITSVSPSQSVCNGTNTILSVTATGAANLAYQWFKDGIVINDALASTYSITGVTNGALGNYNVVVKGFGSTVTSSGISLTSCNNAINFDGVNDRIDVVASAQLNNLGTTEFTFESWVNIPSSGSALSLLRKTGDYNFFILNGNLYLEVWPNGIGNSSLRQYIGTQTVSVNTWSHVAVTYKNNVATFYINGIKQSIGSFSINSIAGNENLGIGFSNTFGNPLIGSLDEIRIWNVALSDADINQNKNKNVVSPLTSLIVNYSFDQGFASGINAGVTTLFPTFGTITGTLSNFGLTGSTSNWLSSGSSITGTYAFVAPSITGITSSQSVLLNGSLPLNVTVTGSGLGYQWFKNSAVIANAVSSTYTLSSISSTSAGTYFVIITSLGGNITSSGINITYTPAPLTVTAFNASKVYGAANPTFTGTVVGLVNGYVVNSTYYLSGSAIIPSVTGVFLANYSLTTVAGTLSITPAPLTVTAFNASKVYGSANPTFLGTIVGLVNGDVLNPTYYLSGSSIILSVTGLVLNNYTLTTVAGTLTTTPVNLTVTAFNANKVYGSANPTFLGTVVGLVNGDVLNPTYYLSGSTITPGVTGAVLANYNLTTVAGTLSITPAPLTVTAINASKVYGSANPTFLGTIVGLVNGDVLNPTYYLSGSTIIPIVTGAVLANYSLTTVAGTLSITPAPLTVTAFNASKVYGTANPTFLGTVIGLVNGDALNPTYYLSGSSIIPSVTGLVLNNYTLTTVAGTLTTTPVNLTVTAFNASKVYGSANPTFLGTVVGLVNGDVISVSYYTVAATLSNVGTYNIVPSVTGVALANYSLITVTGTLTINKASQTILGIAIFPTLTVGGANYSITGVSASSSLPVTITSSNLSVLSLINNLLMPQAAGISTITYAQAGNDNYLATSSTQTATVVSGVLTATTVESNSTLAESKLYPNPNNGSFVLVVAQASIYQIVTLEGIVLQTGNLAVGDNTIVTSLPKGFYLINIGSITKKLLIE